MAKNHHTTEFRKMRGAVLWLHDETCYICQKPNTIIEIHHCNKSSSDNSILNLVPLCPDHHKWAHLYSSQITLSPSYIARLLLKKAITLLS